MQLRLGVILIPFFLSHTHIQYMRERFDFTFKTYVKADHVLLTISGATIVVKSYHHLHYCKGFLLLPLPSAVHSLQIGMIPLKYRSERFSSVQFSHSVVSDSLWPPWTAAHQVSLSFTTSQSLPKFMSIELVRPSNHLILCHPLLLLPSIFLNIRVFSNESALCIRWPKHWSFSFSISPSNENPGLISL